MRSPAEPPSVEHGSPIARTLTEARAAFDRGDVARGDRAYREAIRLAGNRELTLWIALAAEHVAELLKARRPSLASERCAEHLGQRGRENLELRVLQAECLSAAGRHAEAAAHVASIRSDTTLLGPLSRDDDARLHRISGLAAANARSLNQAAHHFMGAELIFDHIDNEAGVERIRRDRRLVGIRRDEELAVADALAGPEPRTVPEHLEQALALKRELRFEKAIETLRRAFTLDPDPAWRADLYHQLIVLYRLTGQRDAAEKLLSSLREAIAELPNSNAGAAMLAEASTEDLYDNGSVEFDELVRRARVLIMKKRLDEAEELLRETSTAAQSNRDIATWHLAAGQLELGCGKRDRDRVSFEQAARHLDKAAEAASTTALAGLRVIALRQLGHVLYRLEAGDDATRCWADASDLEESIARHQHSDRIRVMMLESVRNGYDEWIDAAAEMVDQRGREQLAGLVVAIEAARGTTILDRILPDGAALLRNLPRPHDLDHAWQWINALVRDLPRSQVVWLMHGTEDKLHHVILGEGVVAWKTIDCGRDDLEESVKELKNICSIKDVLEACIEPGKSGEPAVFDAQVEDLAVRVGVDELLPHLTPRVRRIAIVAGGALSEVPFAAMRIPGGDERVGQRYALSDLPCLSARIPLRLVSGSGRGRRRLRLIPPASDLTAPQRVRGKHVLPGAKATQTELRERLKDNRYRQVRIDTHGKYGHGNAPPWLQLAPEGRAGHLVPEDFERLDLHGCGTLMLGACESGMAQRVGRDERVGFVRSGFHAGAAAVVAARWIAPDLVAGQILDRYQRYVRYLPRDVALRRAQLDICRAAHKASAPVPAMDHPARWACWTVYGDSGWETGAGAIVRLVRRAWHEWSRFAGRR